jgi:hypothetical protein
MGNDLRRLLEDESAEAIDKFFRDYAVDSFIADSTDEWLEILAIEAGPKIAELWELSEPAGERLADLMCWGISSPLIDRSYLLPFVLVVNTKKRNAARNLREKSQELLLSTNVVVGLPKVMEDGHICLDVTYLPQRALNLAYKGVVLCRQYLGIKKEDLREGAPAAIETGKALEAAHLRNVGTPSKEIAEELGCRIYRKDNPSGTYPLLRKYLKQGRVILQRVDALDEFLNSVAESLLHKRSS